MKSCSLTKYLYPDNIIHDLFGENRINEHNHRMIQQIIPLLSVESQQMIDYRYERCMSYEDISKALNIPLSHVNSRLSNLRKEVYNFSRTSTEIYIPRINCLLPRDIVRILNKKNIIYAFELLYSKIEIDQIDELTEYQRNIIHDTIKRNLIFLYSSIITKDNNVYSCLSKDAAWFFHSRGIYTISDFGKYYEYQIKEAWKCNNKMLKEVKHVMELTDIKFKEPSMRSTKILTKDSSIYYFFSDNILDMIVESDPIFNISYKTGEFSLSDFEKITASEMCNIKELDLESLVEIKTIMNDYGVKFKPESPGTRTLFDIYKFIWK